MNLVAKDVNPWTNGPLMARPRSYERGYDAQVHEENASKRFALWTLEPLWGAPSPFPSPPPAAGERVAARPGEGVRGENPPKRNFALRTPAPHASSVVLVRVLENG